MTTLAVLPLHINIALTLGTTVNWTSVKVLTPSVSAPAVRRASFSGAKSDTPSLTTTGAVVATAAGAAETAVGKSSIEAQVIDAVMNV